MAPQSMARMALQGMARLKLSRLLSQASGKPAETSSEVSDELLRRHSGRMLSSAPPWGVGVVCPLCRSALAGVLERYLL